MSNAFSSRNNLLGKGEDHILKVQLLLVIIEIHLVKAGFRK